MAHIEEGKPLTAEGLFRLVADEAFRDGVIEDFENKVMQVLAGFLGIADDRALEIARNAQSRFEAGQLGERRPMSPAAVYRQALFYICSDGEIDEDEARMLDGLRRLFRITDDHHAGLLQAMRQHFVDPDEADGIALIQQAVDELVGSLDAGDWNRCRRGFRALRLLGRRLAVLDQSTAYLDGLRRATETALQVTDAYNRQKTVDSALDLFDHFFDHRLQSPAAAVAFADVCRSLPSMLVGTPFVSRLAVIVRRQGLLAERFSGDPSVARAAATVILACLRLVDGGMVTLDGGLTAGDLTAAIELLSTASPDDEVVAEADARCRELVKRLSVQ